MLLFSFDSHINATTMFYCDYYENILRSRKHIKTYRVFKINVMFVEKPIPRYNGYFARNDGTIRTPAGNVLKGFSSETCTHLRIRIGFKYLLVHRLIALTFVNNPRPDIFHLVDHIDQNEWNNRPENLRWLNTQLNALNNSALGCSFVNEVLVGVKMYKVKKWRACVTISKKHHHLGYYKTFLEGYLVSKKFRQEAFHRIYQSHINETPRTRSYLFGD
jgi:hypothetical protein